MTRRERLEAFRTQWVHSSSQRAERFRLMREALQAGRLNEYLAGVDRDYGRRMAERTRRGEDGDSAEIRED